jgi:hypothetical protein
MAFLCVLLLTQLGLYTDIFDGPSFFGFPKWLYYLCAVHLLFVAAFYLFIQDQDKSNDAL